MSRNDRSNERQAPRVSTDPLNDDLLDERSSPWTEEDVHAFERETSRVGDLLSRGREAVRTGYDRSLAYGRDNPGILLAIGFGIGLALGMLLAVPARGRRSSPDFEI